MNITTYQSAWGWLPWTVMAFTAACCLWPIAVDPHAWLPILHAVLAVACEYILFRSIYYKVVGDQLWVYAFFRPAKYPIRKIAQIRPTKSILSAPAISITARLAITFTDRSIMRSYLPLVISPKDRAKFIAQLRDINPEIKVQD